MQYRAVSLRNAAALQVHRKRTKWKAAALSLYYMCNTNTSTVRDVWLTFAHKQRIMAAGARPPGTSHVTWCADSGNASAASREQRASSVHIAQGVVGRIPTQQQQPAYNSRLLSPTAVELRNKYGEKLPNSSSKNKKKGHVRHCLIISTFVLTHTYQHKVTIGS